MDMQKVLEIVKKNVNEEQMLKDLLAEFAKPALLDLKAKVDSGEIDLIHGTDIDKAVLDQVLDLILAKV